MLAGPVPLKPAPRREWVGGSLFIDGGDQDAATEYLVLLEKQAVDGIALTPSVSSRTKKRKLNSSEEVSRFSIPLDHKLTVYFSVFQGPASNI